MRARYPFPVVAVVIGVAGCTSMIAGDPFPQGQSRAPGCDAWRQQNMQLKNNQLVVLSGGQCGGKVTLFIRFSGESQFFNDDKTPYAEVRIYPDQQSVPKDDPNTPLPEQELLNVCNGKSGSKDTKFNTFNIHCQAQFSVPANSTRTFLLNYATDRVKSSPLNLYTEAFYEPAQVIGLK